MNPYMKRAVQEALKGLGKKEGGPFGAVIVRKGKVIAAGHNTVLSTHDPTCHAEMNALREASRKLKRFDLSDCEIYSSCEPCPMCFAAIHWAKMRRLYYGCTARDAERIGFDDQFIYDAIKGKGGRGRLATRSLDRKACLVPFKIWDRMEEKTPY